MNTPTLGVVLGQAAIGVASAALVWLLARGAHAQLRVPHSSRSYWRGAWALAVLPTLLAIAVHAFVPPSIAPPLPLLGDLSELTGAVALAGRGAVSDAPAATRLLSPLLAVVYLAGLALAGLRWLFAVLALRRMLGSARPLADPALPGPLSRSASQRLRRSGVCLLVVDALVSPFACVWPRRSIVVPAALLHRLDDRQLMMVLYHEAEHLARHDPQWSALQRLVGALLWFNPFVHAISRRLRLAAELASDAAAVGADPRARRLYAQAYLETLRITAMRTHSEAGFAPVVAFSAQDKGSHAMRINHIVNGDQRSPRHPRLAAVLGGLALASGLGLSVVQAASALPDAGPVSFIGPIIDGRISSHFGTRRPELSKHAHNGIDLAAARGTAVHAPAAGVVSVATSHYEPVPGYGSVIVVEHGDGWQSLYAHLDSIDVRVGESVSSGQMIGRVGTTGLATGPHVHVEVLRDGERIDPASVIAEPVAAK